MTFPDLTFLILPLAFLLDVVFGEPRFHIAVLSGKIAEFFERRIPRFGPLFDFLSGTFFYLSICFFFFTASVFFLVLPEIFYAVAGALLLKQTFALRSMLEHTTAVLREIERGNLREARRRAGFIVSRDTSNLSEGLLLSCTVESLAENLTDAMLSPVFWFGAGGLPFAVWYRVSNTLDATVGYRTERLRYFGRFSAFADEVLNFFPAVLSVPFVLLASLFVGGNPARGLLTVFRYSKSVGSLNGGILIPLFAGVLGVKLEKRGYYVVEGGGRYPSSADVTRAQKIYVLASVMFLPFSLLLYGFAGGKVEEWIAKLIEGVIAH